MEPPQSSCVYICDDPVVVESEAENRIGAITGIAISGFFILFFIVSYYFFSTSQPRLYKSTLFSRLKTFFSGSLSQLTLTLIIAFLVSDTVAAFNNFIMYPIIKSAFPKQLVWNLPVDLPRGAEMYPAQFFQSLLSFIITLLLLFIIVEAISQIYARGYVKYVKYFFTFIFVSLLVSVFFWNIYDIANPETTVFTQSQIATAALSQLQPQW